ncbi:MAG: DUF4038 domain-containing protein, partial [Deltaproteobacteria bacterium]|nr:DUF4038 domain-containing protein [Deltaproteobacteria bacterium]
YNFTVAGGAKLAHYLCARYGAYPVIFFTSQEVDATDDGNKLDDEWKPSFDAWNICDAYEHPATAHTHPSTDENAAGDFAPQFTWADESGHDLFFHQWGHRGIPPTLELLEAYWRYAPAKPFLEVEANYEELTVNAPHAASVRQSAYKSIQGGGAGFGYGASGLWNFCTTHTQCACCHDVWGGAPWHEALHYPGGAQMAHLRRFYESLPWWRLEPRFSDAAWSSFSSPENAVLKTLGSDLYVLYAYGLYTPGTLRQLALGARYRVMAFDPRHGWFYDLGTTTSNNGDYETPGRPSDDDWLFVLSREGTAPTFFSVDAAAETGGRIFPSGALAVPGGGELTLHALPRTGFSLTAITLDGQAQGAATSVILSNVTAAHGVRATFSGQSPPHLIAEWKLEGAVYAPALDHHGDHHGVPTPGVGFEDPGVRGKGRCAHLDGVGDSLDVPDAPSLKGMTGLTLSLWIRLDALPATGQSFAPLSKENAYRLAISADGHAHVAIATSDDGWYTPDTTLDFGAALAPGTWHHLVATYDGLTLRTYLNGALVKTGLPLSGPIASASTPLRFGASTSANITETAARIDEVRIYDAALSTAEVAQLNASY